MRVQFTAPLAALIALATVSGCVPHGAPVTAPAEKEEPFVAALTVEAEDVPVHAEPSRSAPVVESLRSGDRLRLIEREPEWLLIVAPSGVRGYVEESSLVSPECTSDRAEPLIVEEPVFWFSQEPPHGRVVLEAEYTAEARLVAAHVVENTVGDPSFQQHAIDDLRRMRFLRPPTTASLSPSSTPSPGASEMEPIRRGRDHFESIVFECLDSRHILTPDRAGLPRREDHDVLSSSMIFASS